MRSSDATNVTSTNQIAPGIIVNSDVNASAGIVYSKLNLALGIVNADISATAGIVYSKLNLTGSILNADIANNAGIVLSKLGNVGADNAFVRSNGTNWASEVVTFTEQIGQTVASGGETTLTVSSLPDLNYMIAEILITLQTSSAEWGVQFNGDTGANYGYRSSLNGGADVTATGQTSANITGGSTMNTNSRASIVLHIYNLNLGDQKVFRSANANDNGSSTPSRNEGAGYWSNTAAVINSLSITRISGTGTLKVGSRITVFGHD